MTKKAPTSWPFPVSSDPKTGAFAAPSVPLPATKPRVIKAKNRQRAGKNGYRDLLRGMGEASL